MKSSLSQKKLLRLEDELTADLTDSARCRIGGLAELAAVCVANDVSEVRVVEDIEHLDAKVELCSFREFRVFLHSHIRVDRSRPVEEELLRAAGLATHFEDASEIAGEG